MARKVTLEDIRYMNDLYYINHSYADTARQTGWSASTVRSYIDHNYSPVLEDAIIRFDPDKDMPEFSTEIFQGIDNYGDLCVLSADEQNEIVALWKELKI